MILFSKLALLAAATGNTAYPVAVPTPATPLGSPGSWVMSNDYPAAALRQEQEGIVGFRLTISSDGVVSNCQITVSSSFPILDEATCRLVTARARFKPATDAKGNAAEGSFSSRVRWAVPRETPPPRPGTLVISMIVEADGSQSDCRVLQSSGESEGKAPVGPFPCSKRRIVPAYQDAKGNPVRKRVTFTNVQSVLVEDVKP
jgi:periplasmic protein TonB